MRWVIEILPVLGLGVALTVLIAVSFYSYRNLTNLRTANDWVEHSHQVSDYLDAIVLHLTEAETGQRGYLLTGKVGYLDRYQKAIKLIEPETQKLRKLTLDNTSSYTPHVSIRQSNLIVLESLIKAKLAELSQTINLRQNKGLQPAVKVVLTHQGKQFMDQIQQTILEMKASLESFVETAAGC